MRKGHLLTPNRIAVNVTLELSPVRQAFDDFQLSRQAMRCTPATLEFYHYTAGVFVTWLERQNVTRTDEVTAALVREWLAGLQGKDTTLHAKARGVRTMLRFWLAEKYIPEAVTFQMPRLEKKRLPFLSPEQFRKALKAAPGARERALLLFLADSGVRRAEALALNWGDVDLNTGAVIIRRGKGNKARVAAIGSHTRRALIAYRRRLPLSPEALTPLLQTDEGNRLSAFGLRSLFVRLGKRAGFPISPHMLRRSFAMQSLRAGMDVITLQRLMGHADVTTTAHYVQYVEDDLLAEHKAHGLDEWL